MAAKKVVKKVVRKAPVKKVKASVKKVVKKAVKAPAKAQVNTTDRSGTLTTPARSARGVNRNLGIAELKAKLFYDGKSKLWKIQHGARKSEAPVQTISELTYGQWVDKVKVLVGK